MRKHHLKNPKTTYREKIFEIKLILNSFYLIRFLLTYSNNITSNNDDDDDGYNDL